MPKICFQLGKYCARPEKLGLLEYIYLFNIILITYGGLALGPQPLIRPNLFTGTGP